jgi:hypothetical protein
MAAKIDVARKEIPTPPYYPMFMPKYRGMKSIQIYTGSDTI